MMWTDDPVRDAASYDASCDRWVSRRPVCAKCGEHIQDEYGYEIDGLYCENCKDEWLLELRVDIEDRIAKEEEAHEYFD